MSKKKLESSNWNIPLEEMERIRKEHPEMFKMHDIDPLPKDILETKVGVDKDVKDLELLIGERKLQMENITRHLTIFEEGKIIKGLCKCDHFKRYVKQRYYLTVRMVGLNQHYQLIRKKDDKVLEAWII